MLNNEERREVMARFMAESSMKLTPINMDKPNLMAVISGIDSQIDQLQSNFLASLPNQLTEDQKTDLIQRVLKKRLEVSQNG